MKRIKAYLIYFFTGWKSVDVFGNPDVLDGTFLACLQNNVVIELQFSYYGKRSRWYKIGVGEIYPSNRVVYWRQLPKHP